MNVIGTLIINSSYTLNNLKKQFQKSCKMNVIYVTKKEQDTIAIMIIAWMFFTIIVLKLKNNSTNTK